jgi:ribose 5-phosphate isomerase B
MGHQVVDEGTGDEQSVDYPDFASAVSRKVSKGEVDRGLLICGTGIGMAIMANKFPGVRAAVCRDQETARISRAHNDLNILRLAGDVEQDPAVDLSRLLEVWLTTPFEAGRHARRLRKIGQVEEETRRCP